MKSRASGSVTYIIICFLIHKSICWEISTKYPDLYHRDCMIVPENNYSTLAMVPIKSKCLPFECWKSQLNTIYKANLTWIYNTFRNELAQKDGSNGMIKVNWHWMLEMESMKILKNCPDVGAAIIETRDVGGLDYDMTCEETILFIPRSFKTPTDFANYFPQLLRGQQMEKSEYFKLPGVSHFGCAVIFTQNNARLVCLYCAKADQLSSDSSCPHHYEKNNSSEFSYLCTHKFKNSLYGCEPNSMILTEYCQGDQPNYLKKTFDGSLIKIHSVTDGKDFLIDIVRSPGSNITNIVLGCEDQGGQCAPQLPTWNFVYEPDDIIRLNSSTYSNTNNTIYIRYGAKNVYFSIAETPEKILQKASCCTTILIFFLITTIPVLVIMYFTYLHRKQHPQ